MKVLLPVDANESSFKLEDVRRTNSVWMMQQHRWCVRVCITESDSHLYWIWPNVWIGKSSSVVNRPSSVLLKTSTEVATIRFFPFVILCRHLFDGNLCVFSLNILHWSWDQTVAFLDTPPSFLGSLPYVGTSRLWRLLKLHRFGVVEDSVYFHFVLFPLVMTHP